MVLDPTIVGCTTSTTEMQAGPLVDHPPVKAAADYSSAHPLPVNNEAGRGPARTAGASDASFDDDRGPRRGVRGSISASPTHEAQAIPERVGTVTVLDRPLLALEVIAGLADGESSPRLAEPDRVVAEGSARDEPSEPLGCAVGSGIDLGSRVCSALALLVSRWDGAQAVGAEPHTRTAPELIGHDLNRPGDPRRHRGARLHACLTVVVEQDVGVRGKQEEPARPS